MLFACWKICTIRPLVHWKFKWCWALSSGRTYYSDAHDFVTTSLERVYEFTYIGTMRKFDKLSGTSIHCIGLSSHILSGFNTRLSGSWFYEDTAKTQQGDSASVSDHDLLIAIPPAAEKGYLIQIELDLHRTCKRLPQRRCQQEQNCAGGDVAVLCNAVCQTGIRMMVIKEQSRVRPVKFSIKVLLLNKCLHVCEKEIIQQAYYDLIRMGEPVDITFVAITLNGSGWCIYTVCPVCYV